MLCRVTEPFLTQCCLIKTLLRDLRTTVSCASKVTSHLPELCFFPVSQQFGHAVLCSAVYLHNNLKGFWSNLNFLLFHVKLTYNAKILCCQVFLLEILFLIYVFTCVVPLLSCLWSCFRLFYILIFFCHFYLTSFSMFFFVVFLLLVFCLWKWICWQIVPGTASEI